MVVLEPWLVEDLRKIVGSKGGLDSCCFFMVVVCRLFARERKVELSQSSSQHLLN